MTRLHVIFATSVYGCFALHTPAPAAEGFDGKWTGTISCAKLSFTKGPFKTAIDMTVDKGAVSYARDVYNRDG